MTSLWNEQQHAVDALVSLVAAYLLTLPLAIERRRRSISHVGLRTLPIVAVGTCAYLLISRYLFEAGVFTADGEARVLRAMMTGIGFIGGGAILKGATRDRGVTGLATATSVWTTGAIGASVAHGHYAIALILSGTSLLVLFRMWRRPRDEKRVTSSTRADEDGGRGPPDGQREDGDRSADPARSPQRQNLK